jgi:L-fucose isomerase-like protein
MALVTLNDEGIPAACEGDLTALITMIFLERISNRPGFMGNVIYANPEESLIEINHCVFPFQMDGYGQSKKPYMLRDYHGRGYGVTASSIPTVGTEVTIGRFQTDLKDFLCTSGRITQCGENHCRTNLRIQISDVNVFLNHAPGNHHILVYGNHTERIRELCALFHIKAIFL